jgi:succinoglycan biosynthesis protein ExoA
MNELATELRPLRTPARPALAPRPFISVIVPVRNEEAFIGDTLDQLFRQLYHPERFEVLVADGGSTDRTRAVVAGLQCRHANLHLLDNPRRWSSAGRNLAVESAQGDLIVLIDGHCEIENPCYLAEVAAAFQRSGADCVGRPQPLDVTGATRLQRAISVARSSRLGHHPASHIYSNREGFVPPESVAVAYRRSVFEKVGLFDEAFDACEDVEFNHRVARAGLRCFFTPRVRVRYYPRDSVRGLFRQMVRYGRGRVRLLRKHPATFSLPGFLPAAFLAGVLTGPVLAWLWPVLGLVYGGVLGTYGLTLLLFSLLLGVRNREVGLVALLPLVYLAIHAGSGVGILWEAVTGRHPARRHAEARPEQCAWREAG